MLRTGATVDVVLKRQATHRRYWILCGDDEIFSGILDESASIGYQQEHNSQC
jgi:hypothetical protein